MRKVSKNIRLHILNASGKFQFWEEKIYKVTRVSLKLIKTKIPISDVDIVYYNNPWATIKGRGIGGSSRGAHTVFVSLDLSFKDIESVISKEIPRVLTHELHHIVRFREVGYRRTLLDGLVAEGLAGHFEIELLGGKPLHWYKVVENKDLKRLLKLAEREYFESNNPLKWFFGKVDKKIPKWTGYTIGFEIVGKYLRNHPNKNASGLYKTVSKGFI